MQKEVFSKLQELSMLFEATDKPLAYISGKVTGLPKEVVKLKFDAAEKQAIKLGYQVFNPVAHIAPDCNWELAMKICIAVLPMCEIVFLCHDWMHSDGAKEEARISTVLNIPTHKLY